MTEIEQKALAAYEALIRECKRIAENVWNEDLDAADPTPMERLVFLKEVTATHLIGTERRGIVVSVPADPDAPVTVPFGKQKGTPVTQVAGIDLQGMLDWVREGGPSRLAKYAEFVAAGDARLQQLATQTEAIQTQPLDEKPLALVTEDRP